MNFSTQIKTLSILFALSGCVLFLPSISAQTVTGVGDIPGGSVESRAFGVSGDGLVVTGDTETAIGDQAFLWTSEDGISLLGLLPQGITSEGISVSHDGSVIAGNIALGTEDNAFQWTSENSFIPIGDLGGNGDTFANGISGNGNVIVGRSRNNNQADEAFVWTLDDGIDGIENLPDDSTSDSEAFDVSDNGSVVVGCSENIDGDEEAFVWTEGTGMVGLGNLEGFYRLTRALGVSADGSVIVGEARFTDSQNEGEAFRWTAETGIVGLGLFPSEQERNPNPPEGQSPFTRARAVSADGSVIVGDGFNFEIGDHAMVWSEAAGVRTLQDVLLEFGVNDTQWEYRDAHDVSSDGRVIVGEGRSGLELGDFTPEGFVADFHDLDLTWIGDGSGEWDQLNNWLGRIYFPGPTDHAIIESSNSITVIGPSQSTEVDQLSVGTNGAGADLITLQVQSGGVLSVSGTAMIGSHGRLIGEGQFVASTISNQGEICLDEDDLLVSSGIFANDGLLHGDGRVDGVIFNSQSGEITIGSGERLLLSGDSHVNDGEVQLLGGILDVLQSFNNGPDGLILGRGTMFFDGLLFNQGTIALSGGFTDIIGDVENSAGSIIITSGGGSTTFFDDVVHNGFEIRTSSNCSTTFFGSFSGAGSFSGPGDVFMEGDLQPGNSPASIFFEGNLNLGSLANIEIEIGGETAGFQHDQLLVAGNLSLEGNLTIIPTDGFSFAPDQEFRIIEVNGLLTGQFNGLPEGSTVGSFGGVQLTITYTGGDGNDVVLRTSEACVGSVDTDGMLIVNGTLLDDVILVENNGTQTTVTLNGCSEVFSKLSGITINALSGNDQISADFQDIVIFCGDGNDEVTITGFGRSEVHGEGGNDTIVGGFAMDQLFGGEGDDNLIGRNGNDLLDGGAPPLENPGTNTLQGGPGADTIIGGSAVDIISGGTGNDVINGFAGDDNISGNNGADLISGGGGNDLISAGLGFDTVMGGPGDDNISGGDGQDVLQGGQGNDTLNGNLGNDILFGNAGDDTLTGGPGNDELNGGPGNDTATDEGENGETGIENGP